MRNSPSGKHIRAEEIRELGVDVVRLLGPAYDPAPELTVALAIVIFERFREQILACLWSGRLRAPGAFAASLL